MATGGHTTDQAHAAAEATTAAAPTPAIATRPIPAIASRLTAVTPRPSRPSSTMTPVLASRNY